MGELGESVYDDVGVRSESYSVRNCVHPSHAQVPKKVDVGSDKAAVNLEEGNVCPGAEADVELVEIGNKEPYVSLYRKAAAEAISTFVMVFLGCGAIAVNEKRGGIVTHLGVSLVFGLAIMAMIKAVGHISGGHMNPAVSIAFACHPAREFPWKAVPHYIGAQIVGATTAAFVLRALFFWGDSSAHGHLRSGLGVTHPTGTDAQAFFMEFILTFILMFTVCAVAVDSKSVGELAGIILGFTVALNAVVGGPVSGASMNPARSLGPAIAANYYKGLWIYFLAPTAGAVSGATVYHIVHGPQHLPNVSEVRLTSRRRVTDVPTTMRINNGIHN